MSSDDPFTSVQWDREDNDPVAEPQQEVIAEESPTNSLLLAQEHPTEPVTTEHQPETDTNEGTEAPSAVTESAADTSKVPEPTSLEPTAQPEPGQAPPEAPPTYTENLDQKRMEEQFSKYSIDLQVSNPISDRDSNSKSYISYLVTTTTNHPAVKKLAASDAEGAITVKLRRRYGDFRFLHNCLVNDFPQLFVPPLPPKLNFKYLTGDTFSTSFVHKRLHSLNRFTTFISQHKLLLQLSVFHYFISDSAEWATFTKNLKIAKGEDESVVGKVVNEELLTETVMNFFTSLKHKRETNKDILEISDKLKKLYENLLKLDKIFSKLNRKNSDLRTDYEHFLVQINRLASVHSATAQANDGGQVDPNRSLASVDALDYVNNFKVFSESLLYFLEHWSDLHHYIDESFLVSLKDCAKYIVRFTDLIELQHNKKIDLQVLQDYLVKARNDLVSIGGGSTNAPPPNPVMIGQSSGGLVNNTTQLIKDTLSTSATAHIGSSQTDNKKLRLEQKIQLLEQEIAAQTQMVNQLTSRIINEEYPNWDRFNKKQLKQSMVELCDQEISFYKGLVENWTDVELKLMKRLDELG